MDAEIELTGRCMEEGLTFLLIADQIAPAKKRITWGNLKAGSVATLPLGKYASIYLVRERGASGWESQGVRNGGREYSNSLKGEVAGGRHIFCVTEAVEPKRSILGFFDGDRTRFDFKPVTADACRSLVIGVRRPTG